MLIGRSSRRSFLYRFENGCSNNITFDMVADDKPDRPILDFYWWTFSDGGCGKGGPLCKFPNRLGCVNEVLFGMSLVHLALACLMLGIFH